MIPKIANRLNAQVEELPGFHFPRMIAMRVLTVLIFVLGIDGFLPAHAAASAPRFTDDGQNRLVFDTGIVRGSIQKDGAGEGITPISFSEAAQTFGINHGLLVPYRFLTPQKRYGFGSWEWARTGRIKEDGSAELYWAGASDRPFRFSINYKWSAADTLDATIEFTSETKLEKFEMFLGSYLANSIFTQTKAYVQDTGNGRPSFVSVVNRNGFIQLFPRDSAVLPIVNDGRWKFPPYPMKWRIRGAMAGPVAVKQDPSSGATVLLMAPPQDCFAVSMWHQDAKQGGVYLSMFGRDIAAGQRATAHIRLVFGKNLSDEEVVRRYAAYLEEIRSDIDPSVTSEVAAIAAKKAPWNSSDVPRPDADGWITLFDGQHLYGCDPNDQRVTSRKVFLNDGSLGLDGAQVRFNLKAHNAALRVRGKKISGRNITLSIGPYRGWFNGKFICFGIHKTAGDRIVEELAVKKAPSIADFFDMEMTVINGKITLKANGQPVVTAQSDPIQGDALLSVWAVDGLSVIKTIEVKRFDK